AAVSAITSRGGNRGPVWPSITSSGLPARSLAITAVSTARASRSAPVMPKPAYEASTQQSLPARISGTSLTVADDVDAVSDTPHLGAIVEDLRTAGAHDEQVRAGRARRRVPTHRSCRRSPS